MDISAVITQLRSYAPVFNGNVAGSADYAAGLESVVNLPMPSAYVYPLDDDPDGNENRGSSLRQLVRERIAVVVCVSNVVDRRGQGAAQSVDSIKYDIFHAILNWNPYTNIASDKPPRANQGLQYAGGHLLNFDRARLWWQFEFMLAVTINTQDGFMYHGEQLTNIVISPTNFPPVNIGITFPTYVYGCVSLKMSASGTIT